MASKEATLEISTDLAELKQARAFLRDVCRQRWDLAAIEEDLSQLELALTEAVSNIMIHAFKRRTDGLVRLQASVVGDRLSLGIFHRGEAFDPARAESPPLGTPREGRMGMQIIQHCVDEVTYSRSAEGESSVQMVKTIRSK